MSFERRIPRTDARQQQVTEQQRRHTKDRETSDFRSGSTAGSEVWGLSGVWRADQTLGNRRRGSLRNGAPQRSKVSIVTGVLLNDIIEVEMINDPGSSRTPKNLSMLGILE